MILFHLSSFNPLYDKQGQKSSQCLTKEVIFLSCEDFFLPVDYHYYYYYYYYYYYFIFIRSEEHLPTYCRTEGVQFTVSGSINISKKIILGSPTSEYSHLSLLLADMDVLFPLRNVLSSKEMAVFAGQAIKSPAEVKKFTTALKPIQVPSSIKME